MNVSEEVDAFELSRRATANGWRASSYCVLHSEDAAQAIADQVKDRDDVLLVMATSAKRPLLGHILGSAANPTLIHCVDPNTRRSAATSVIVGWWRTFQGPPARTVEITGREGPESWLPRSRNAVFVCTSTNFTSGHHWHSATRELVQRSVHPVLVVPDRLDDQIRPASMENSSAR